jgi:hypothetical protein
MGMHTGPFEFPRKKKSGLQKPNSNGCGLWPWTIGNIFS